MEVHENHDSFGLGYSDVRGKSGRVSGVGTLHRRGTAGQSQRANSRPDGGCGCGERGEPAAGGTDVGDGVTSPRSRLEIEATVEDDTVLSRWSELSVRADF